REAVAPLDHRRLDVEYAALGDREPSTEALAVALFGALAPHVRSRLEQARLLGVRVAENDGLWADRREGGAVEVTRAYAFSAAHRLADPHSRTRDTPDDEAAGVARGRSPFARGVAGDASPATKKGVRHRRLQRDRCRDRARARRSRSARCARGS